MDYLKKKSRLLGSKARLHYFPHLFDIAIQPLMLCMDAKISSNQLHGHEISFTLIVSHRLYMDDIEKFILTTQRWFDGAVRVLMTYTLASSLRLNLGKSIIVPLYPLLVPRWLDKTSCRILKNSKIHKFLDTPLGCISITGDFFFCLDKVSEHISLWLGKLFSFLGKILLVCHILQLILIYHLMFHRNTRRGD